MEQPRVLQYHAEHHAQLAAVEILDIVPVYQNRPVVDVIEAHQELDHRRLARTGRADDGNLLAFFHLRAKIVDNNLILVITKVHVVELHVPLQAFHRYRIWHRLVFLLFLQELEDALRRRGRRLQHVGHLRHLLDGRREIAHILDEGLDVPDGNGAADGQVASQNRHAHVTQISHEAHQRHHQSRQELGTPCRIVQRVVCLLEHGQHVLFLIEHLHDVVSAVNLFHLAVHLAQILLLPAEIFLRTSHDGSHQPQGERKNQKCHQGHRHTDGNHHHQHADQRRHRSNQRRNALVQALPQRIHVVGNPRQHLAVGAGFKIIHRHAADFLRQFLAELICHFLGNVTHHVALDTRAQAAYHVQSQREK